MKKHLALTFLFALSSIIARAQSQTYLPDRAPANTVLKVRQAMEEQSFSIFKGRDDDEERRYRDCDHCQKHKKGKKRHCCDQKGNHYGKHKNRRDKHSCCACDHHDCQSDNRYGRDDDGWNRDNRDGDERNSGWSRRDRDDGSREETRPAQGNPRVKAKNRSAPATRPTRLPTGAKRKEAPRPDGSRR